MSSTKGPKDIVLGPFRVVVFLTGLYSALYSFRRKKRESIFFKLASQAGSPVPVALLELLFLVVADAAFPR